LFSYRTLSIHVNDGLRRDFKKRNGVPPVAAIRAIDIHRAEVSEVFTRFSTSPTLGLEQAAVARRAVDGRNVISPPPTQYWKKVLNYIFGGFNFLMWIAFIVTLVSFDIPPPFFFLKKKMIMIIYCGNRLVFSRSRTSP
jgi:sodium/potassium-transporting ATPase subunit alpha